MYLKLILYEFLDPDNNMNTLIQGFMNKESRMWDRIYPYEDFYTENCLKRQ